MSRKKKNEDKNTVRINTQGLAVGTIILFLSAMCLVQTSIMGCSSAEDVGDADEISASLDGVPFYERDEGEPVEMPENWEPVRQNVFDQVSLMFEDSREMIDSLDRSENSVPAMRLRLEVNGELDTNTQLMDGMIILHDTFPEKLLYLVEVGHETLEFDWDQMIELYESGYDLDIPASESGPYWDAYVLGIESDEDTGSGMMLESGT